MPLTVAMAEACERLAANGRAVGTNGEGGAGHVADLGGATVVAVAVAAPITVLCRWEAPARPSATEQLLTEINRGSITNQPYILHILVVAN